MIGGRFQMLFQQMFFHAIPDSIGTFFQMREEGDHHLFIFLIRDLFHQGVSSLNWNLLIRFQ